jgi:N-methylhydantoinase A
LSDRSGQIDPLDLARRFELEHERTYGHRADGDPIEVVNVRLTATVEREASTETARLHGLATTGPESPETGRVRLAYFGPELGALETPVVDRSDVGITPVGGPLIVEEYDATTIVPPGFRVRRDSANNLILEVGS